jgi:plastocyanin
MKLKLTLLLLTISIAAFCKTWTVINSGASFSLSTITIEEGDSVLFVLQNSHDAREVSQATWNNNASTALLGGFQTPTAGGLVLPAKLGVGTHYYVCTPHAGVGMKGQIIVQAATGLLENASYSLSVYPNPAADLVVMKANKYAMGSAYAMYDLTGRQVVAGKIMNESTGIDISQLQSGLYFLQVGTNAKQTFKVVKD